MTKGAYPRAEIYIYIIACCEEIIFDRVVATCTAISVYKGQTIDILWLSMGWRTIITK